jgi:hypothetical protein
MSHDPTDNNPQTEQRPSLALASGLAISAEILRVIADEIGGYEATHPAMQGATAAVHARVMTTLHERLPRELATAFWERSTLRHGLFTPVQFRGLCECAIADYLSSPNRETEPNTPGPLESALRVRAPFAPVATLSISEEHPDRLIVAMVQRMPSGGGWCQLLEVRGNTVRFLPNGDVPRPLGTDSRKET